MRALVRQDDAPVVRLDAQRGDEAVARACDAVRPDVVLLRAPRPTARLLDEHAVAAPGGERPGALLLGVGERQADDVVRAAGEQLHALVGEITSYGGATRRSSGPGGRAVAERAERLDVGHRGDMANAPRGLDSAA